MDPITITTIAVSVISFLIGHYRLLPFMPAPTPAPPPFPSTFGHGELLAYINQAVSNALNALNGGAVPVPAPRPVTPPAPQVDLQTLFIQLLALLEKQITPQVPVPVVVPQPPVAPK